MHSSKPWEPCICSEHFKYAGTYLLVHLCLPFNAMLCHSFVPSDFCFGMIMPLLKEKHADASRLDMYREHYHVLHQLFESVFLALWTTTIYNLDLERTTVAVMLYLYLTSQCSDTVVEFIVLHQSPANHLTRSCNLVCFTKCRLKVYNLCLLRC